MLKPTLLALAFASSLAAQTTWNVGPSGFAQIQDAVSAAVDGDTIVVAPGNYFSFDCLLAVTIVAQVPGTVLVDYSTQQTPIGCDCSCLAAERFRAPSDLVPPLGKSMHVVGIDFGGFSTITGCLTGIQHYVRVSRGRVTFDSCRIARMRVDNAVAVLQDCDVIGSDGQVGILIEQGDVTITGGAIVGAGIGPPFGIGIPKAGIEMNGGRLHACHTMISAGDPGATGLTAPGIDASGGEIWLSDAVVVGEFDCAVRATGEVRMDRVTLIDGTAGCASVPVGTPLIGMERSGAITIGSQFSATMTSQSGDLQVFYGSVGLADPLLIPLLDQPIWIDVDGLFFSALGVADASGQTTFAFPVPNLPLLVGYEYWLQGVGGAAFPLQSTVPVGGITR